MIYCDTSLVIAALTPELRTAGLQQWFLDNAAAGLAISWWTETEVASAVALKKRSGALTADQADQVLVVWRELAQRCHLLEVARGHFTAAAALLLATGSRLRAGDALHLAIAETAQSPLATLDADLAAAAAARGLGIDL